MTEKEEKLVNLLSGVARFVYIKEIDELYGKPARCDKCLAFWYKGNKVPMCGGCG